MSVVMCVHERGMWEACAHKNDGEMLYQSNGEGQLRSLYYILKFIFN